MENVETLGPSEYPAIEQSPLAEPAPVRSVAIEEVSRPAAVENSTEVKPVAPVECAAECACEERDLSKQSLKSLKHLLKKMRKEQRHREKRAALISEIEQLARAN